MESTTKSLGSSSEENKLLSFALSYADRGWPVFPCKPRGKTPLTSNGFHAATCDEEQIRAWWAQWPNANVAIATGHYSGLYVLDIDAGKGGSDTLEDKEHQFGKLPDTVTSLTGGGGFHYLFNWLPGLKNSNNYLGKGLDTRGDGGYIIAPPSVHESGRTYEWEASSEPDNCEIAEPPEWTYSAQSKNGQGNLNFVAGKIPHDGSPVLPGGRNEALASLVGQWIQRGDSMTEVVRLANEWNSENPVPLEQKEMDRTIGSVAKTHLNNHPCDVIPFANGEEEEAEEDQEPDSPERTRFPADLLTPPGMLGSIAEWILSTAIYPQPELALATAITFAGAILGRRVATETDLRTNFYCLGVADSGSGKDHSRQAIKRACATIGITDKILGGEEVTSDSAIYETLHTIPSCLFLWDEIGHLIASCNSRNAASHQKAIPTALTKLFSSANGVLLGKEYADRKTRPRRDLVQPNACIYGTTVPGRLAAGLTPDELRDGFLGRMLVFHAGESDPEPQSPGPRTLPADIKAWILSWWNRQPQRDPSDGNLQAATENHPLVVLSTPEADAILDEFEKGIRTEKIAARRLDNGHDAIWARTAEHARKLSLLVACGCEFEAPTITAEHAEWACRTAWFLTQDLVAWTLQNVGENDHQKAANRVKKFIREAKSITASNLCRKTQWLRPVERDAILLTLINAGIIAIETVQTSRKAKKLFRWRG